MAAAEKQQRSTEIIGSQSCLSTQYAELIALESALDLFSLSWGQVENQGIHKLNIYGDCKSILQALQSPRGQSGQCILIRISDKLKGIEAVGGPEVRFKWVPAHAKVEGNERANTLAKAATAKQVQVPAPPGSTRTAQSVVASHALNIVKRLGQEHWTRLYASAKGGKHARDLDKTLPSQHTKTLYNHLTRPKAAILAQMRTGKCRLKSYLPRIKTCVTNVG